MKSNYSSCGRSANNSVLLKALAIFAVGSSIWAGISVYNNQDRGQGTIREYMYDDNKDGEVSIEEWRRHNPGLVERLEENSNDYLTVSGIEN